MPKLPPAPLQFKPSTHSTAPVSIAVAARARQPLHTVETPALDLSGKPHVIFLIGRGGTGKTTLARWMIERGQSADRHDILAALDPVNRTLSNYFDRVAQPESADPVTSARFLRDLLAFGMQHKHSMVLDLGGGDTTLGGLLDAVPDLAGTLDTAGMAAVALYTLAPRIDDLAPFLSLGFQPAATAFICNSGVADPSSDRTRAFEPLLSQPPVRAACDAGARVIWMPRLDSEVVAQIETQRLSFERASKELGPFAAAQVRHWLTAMHHAFESVGSWLP